MVKHLPGFEGCIHLKEVKVFLALAKDREVFLPIMYFRYRVTELCTEELINAQMKFIIPKRSMLF